MRCSIWPSSGADAMDSVTDFADVLQQRAGMIAEHAMFEER